MTFASHSNAAIKYHTHRETVRFTMEWTIDNFKTFRDQRKSMCGADITMAELGLKDDYEGRWCVRVRPCFKRTDKDIEKRFLSLFLQISDTDPESTGYTDGRTIPVEFNTRVTSGKSEVEIWSNKDPKVYSVSSAKSHLGWDEAVNHDALFGSPFKPGLLKDDCITVTLDVVVYKPPQSRRIPQSIVLSAGSDYQNFANRQLSWFSSQQQRQSADLDFTLQSIDGKEFHTSRWILMAHSPVFAAILKEGSVEQKESRCIMADIDGETTEVMLDYMYGCCIQKIDKDNAEKVLIMADKYELMSLVHACEELLANNVTVDKAIHLLIVASQRGLDRLKTAALAVIPKNMAMVLKSGALEEIMRADTSLMQMVIEHCAETMCLIDDDELNLI